MKYEDAPETQAKVLIVEEEKNNQQLKVNHNLIFIYCFQ